ncbi:MULTISPECIES: hypothetical protein [Achromobacter]|uniref:Uncharacterized protein n=1 Tax=Achromobacter xylosoxidans (strain A8) TaxID=762376 RepID=E3HY76_ACHXA|nr:hypothetical protein [Achromobacter xylosoxidans]ADP20030.1 hypothetical protein AXYL_06746 [Achromobacter xylosoxidans A8]
MTPNTPPPEQQSTRPPLILLALIAMVVLAAVGLDAHPDQLDRAARVAGFLSSLCLLLLVSKPYLVRAYRKLWSRATDDVSTTPSDESHHDASDAAPLPTLTYSTLTAETGHHIGHQLRLGQIQSAEALYSLWASLCSSIEDPAGRNFSITLAKAIEDAKERVNRHGQIVERAIGAYGFTFGDSRAREASLPPVIQMLAADELVRACREELFPGDSTDVLDLIHHSWLTGESLKLVDEAIWSMRSQGRYLQLKAAVPDAPTVTDARERSAELIASVERTLNAHGLRFGVNRAHEVSLPLEIRGIAADQVIRDCQDYVYPGTQTVDIELLVQRAADSGLSQRLVEDAVQAARQSSRYIERAYSKNSVIF